MTQELGPVPSVSRAAVSLDMPRTHQAVTRPPECSRLRPALVPFPTCPRVSLEMTDQIPAGSAPSPMNRPLWPGLSFSQTWSSAWKAKGARVADGRARLAVSRGGGLQGPHRGLPDTRATNRPLPSLGLAEFLGQQVWRALLGPYFVLYFFFQSLSCYKWNLSSRDFLCLFLISLTTLGSKRWPADRA